MLSAEDLERRIAEISGSPQLSALLAKLRARSALVLDRRPVVPGLKAQLTVDGGVCPSDGSPLLFDPWQPNVHRCTRCGIAAAGLRHDRFAARYQHLWLAERIAELAVVGVVDGDESGVATASRLLVDYGARYLQLPNRDNVLGPSRLFFSTYLESIWLCSIVAGAIVLRESGSLNEETGEAVSGIVEEAANLIGEFDEGLSNRQTWNNAALTAAAVWFEDEDLATRAVQGRDGLVGHLVDGFGEDGLWYEGENYHLFALRGLLTGAAWARLAGLDLFEEGKSADRIAAALLAPALTALPDSTFPARKDARFGVSLAQPMYLELWEVGRSALLTAGRTGSANSIEGWLNQLYALAAPAADLLDSYLHEAGSPAPSRRSAADLSWWTLLQGAVEPPSESRQWNPPSLLLESQGLAVLRTGDRYASLECGEWGGGHGHPDRLSLTLHSDGVHWLPDPGTGSYVTRDLFWFRSTLAHNAPRLDGVDQPLADAECEAFDVRQEWSWVKGTFKELARVLVTGSAYMIDVLEFNSPEERLVELPLHLQGSVEVLTPGAWKAVDGETPFLENIEQFHPSVAGMVELRAARGEGRLTVHLHGHDELLRASCPGVPGSESRGTVFMQRRKAKYARFTTLLVPGGEAASGFSTDGTEVKVATASGVAIHRAVPEGWDVEAGGRVVAQLRGRRRKVPGALLRLALGMAPSTAQGLAARIASAPALDGTLAGFDLSHPIMLDHDDQYRRSEEPYGGPEEFAVEAWVNWNAEGLYLAVSVRKADLSMRAPDAPPLGLDNEPDAIHADGLQLYFDAGAGPVGVLVAPDPRSHAVSVYPPGLNARGAWSPTDEGYLVTLGLAPQGWEDARLKESIRFDLLVNEMRPDRERRSGQLVWSGGGGWVYLRGDRQDPARFGVLTLA